MRSSFADSIEQANQHVACARSLFRDGFLGECHRYMMRALSVQLLAWGEADADCPEGEASHERGLRALERNGYRRIERLRAASAASDGAEPGSQRECSAGFDWIWAEVERLASYSTRWAITPHARKRARRVRAALLGGFVVLALLLGYRLWGRPRAQASASFSDDHSAANAVDGLQATEWLLPDGVAGWVDVILPRARTIHRVRLFNAHNRTSADRSARRVRVTAFSEVGSVASTAGAFERFSEERSVLDLPLAAQGVTRVRVEILSHFKSGGGLAEVEVE